MGKDEAKEKSEWSPRRFDNPALIGIEPKNCIHYGADSTIYQKGPFVVKVYDRAIEQLQAGSRFPLSESENLRKLEDYQFQMNKYGRRMLGKNINLPSGKKILLIPNPLLFYGQVQIEGKLIPFSVSWKVPGMNARKYLRPREEDNKEDLNKRVAEILKPEDDGHFDSELRRISSELNGNPRNKAVKLSTLNMTPVVLPVGIVMVVTDIRNFVYPNTVAMKLGGLRGLVN